MENDKESESELSEIQATPTNGTVKSDPNENEKPSIGEGHWTENAKVGLLAHFQPAVQKEVSRTQELVRSQQVLLDALQQETTRIKEYVLTDQLDDFFRDLRIYHTKLLNMKKDMTLIDERVNKMVKKTNRLRILKQKEDMYKAQQEDKKLVLEREITARPEMDSRKDSEAGST